jgi:hypothetical protein
VANNALFLGTMINDFVRRTDDAARKDVEDQEPRTPVRKHIRVSRLVGSRRVHAQLAFHHGEVAMLRGRPEFHSSLASEDCLSEGRLGRLAGQAGSDAYGKSLIGGNPQIPARSIVNCLSRGNHHEDIRPQLRLPLEGFHSDGRHVYARTVRMA